MLSHRVSNALLSMTSDELLPSTLTTFTASDGENLAVQDWPLPQGEPCRGTVLLVHGLGEHVGRYDALARRLNDLSLIHI